MRSWLARLDSFAIGRIRSVDLQVVPCRDPIYGAIDAPSTAPRQVREGEAAEHFLSLAYINRLRLYIRQPTLSPRPDRFFAVTYPEDLGMRLVSALTQF